MEQNTVKTISIVDPKTGSEAMKAVATGMLYDIPGLKTDDIIDRLHWALDEFVRVNYGGWNLKTPQREIKTRNWLNHIIEQARRPDSDASDFIIDQRVRSVLQKYCWNLYLHGEGMGENLKSR